MSQGIKLIRTRRHAITGYWCVQIVMTYFLSLALMAPWEPDGWLMWSMPFMLSAFMLALQWVFLLPVRKPRLVESKGRPVFPALLVGGLLIGVLVIGAVFAVVEVVVAMDLFAIDWPDEVAMITGCLSVVAVSWVVSTPLLMAFSRRKSRHEVVRRIASGLFVGTVIEAAAIIPLDALVRRREECICQSGTYFGIVFCIAVGAMMFGPAIFLPLVLGHRKRWYGRRCPVCDYDMRGTPGAERCPECGAGWRETGGESEGPLS